ncbi:LOW QUALITY PROTEIN: beta-2-glycoprotein 1-like [Python bivittatus]|uniref:Beta-2-glycoprotein 1 n=1 Tax=Python bivittatus TaxID=176946 RepID=A0A9F5MYU7_PYTBI|nr:LOW QUALITY PROTEIN: beta-2-glycoprotein 1-like [Python bivittatus]
MDEPSAPFTVVFWQVLSACLFGPWLPLTEYSPSQQWDAVYAAPVCPRPPEVPLATININKEEYSPGEEIIYSCDLGYIPQSDSMSYTCPLSGIWPNITFKCIPKKCPYPGPLNNGQICITDLNYLSVITFSSVTYSPPISASGILSYRKIKPGNTLFFQDMIRFECLFPFTLLGNKTAICQANGRWSALPTVNANVSPMNIVLGAGNSGIELATYLETPCKIPVKRATMLYNGQKIKVQDLLKPRILHAETIWFFCERKKEKCSDEAPTQCKHGHISVPNCFEGRNMFFSFDYHGNR